MKTDDDKALTPASRVELYNQASELTESIDPKSTEFLDAKIKIEKATGEKPSDAEVKKSLTNQAYNDSVRAVVGVSEESQGNQGLLKGDPSGSDRKSLDAQAAFDKAVVDTYYLSDSNKDEAISNIRKTKGDKAADNFIKAMRSYRNKTQSKNTLLNRGGNNTEPLYTPLMSTESEGE